MRNIFRNIVGAVIISKDKKILFGKKDIKAGGVYSDCWHFPGGGIKQGESELQALNREVTEETGLDISGLQPELISNDMEGESKKILKTGETVIAKMKFFVYKLELEKNHNQVKVTVGDDVIDYCWLGFDELDKVKHVPLSYKVFNKIKYVFTKSKN